MKQTEIGMIPDDWEVKKLGELGFFKGGGTPNTQIKEYWDGDIPWISSSDILKNDIHTLKPSRFITKEALKNSATQLCPQNSILIVSRVGVGKLAITRNEVCTSQDFSNLICNDNNPEYIAYLLSKIMQKKANETQGTSIKGITANEVKEIKIPLPPTLAEQQKIANALSDVDNVISTLEKLITKKKNLKQGTMQQLLTGKKRLPGFAKSNKFKQTEIGEIPEDWEVKSLSSIGEVKMCKRVLKYQTSENGEIPFYKIGTFGKEPDSYISRELFNFLKNNYSYPKKGDILISAAGTIGRTVVFDGKDSFFQDSNIVWLDNDESVISNYFLSYVFKIIKWQTEDGGIVSRLYNNNFRVTQIPIPSKSEQTAIANVFSSMDKEIEALETKLGKYRDLKTGMMQQLLTGKIRLV